MKNTLENLKFDHIGIATESIEKSVESFMILGYKVESKTILDLNQDVKVCFMKKDKSPKIELIEPNSINSPINTILKKNRGIIPYHFCYRINNMGKTIEYLRSKGFIMITKPMVSPAFNNNNVCFLYKSNIGVIEILEIKKHLNKK
jgi:methylmalonyl-CoA/ethylmalonyl-CoA epimerase